MIVYKNITLCLTMGGRPDLLRRSLESINKNWIFSQVIAVNDFSDPLCDAIFREIYPKGILLSDGIKRGHHGAIDWLYGEVRNPYIFHTEDDWVFNKNIDFEEISKFLDKNSAVTSYCFRSPFDFLQAEEKKSINNGSFGNLEYYDLSDVHPEWYGYSFNPHLIKIEKIKSIGFFKKFKKERHVSKYMKERGMNVAYALEGKCEHIGDGLSVANPSANKPKSKLKLWIRSKIDAVKTLKC